MQTPQKLPQKSYFESKERRVAPKSTKAEACPGSLRRSLRDGRFSSRPTSAVFAQGYWQTDGRRPRRRIRTGSCCFPKTLCRPAKSVRHGLLMVPGRNKGRPAGSSLAGVSSLRREVARVDGEKGGGGRTGSRNVQGNGPTSGRQSKQQQQSWRVGGRRGAKGRTAVVSGIERHERESERESVRRVVSVCCSVLLWAALGSLLFLDRKREGGARTNQMGSRLAWVGGTCKVEEGCSSQNLQAGCCRSSLAAAGPGSLVRGKVYLLPPYTYMYLWMYLYVWT